MQSILYQQSATSTVSLLSHAPPPTFPVFRILKNCTTLRKIFSEVKELPPCVKCALRIGLVAWVYILVYFLPNH